MNSLYLMHHGIKGQKWGVRRYQNYDGTLTRAGKDRKMYGRRVQKAWKTHEDVQSIVDTMSSKDKKLLNMDKDQKDYMTLEQGSYIVKRFIEKEGDLPVAFLDLMTDEKSLSVSIGTRSGKTFRNKGYATKCVKKGKEYFEKNKDKFDKIHWWVNKENIASIRTAEKNGFKLDKSSVIDDSPWIDYIYK